MTEFDESVFNSKKRCRNVLKLATVWLKWVKTREMKPFTMNQHLNWSMQHLLKLSRTKVQMLGKIVSRTFFHWKRLKLYYS